MGAFVRIGFVAYSFFIVFMNISHYEPVLCAEIQLRLSAILTGDCCNFLWTPRWHRFVGLYLWKAIFGAPHPQVASGKWRELRSCHNHDDLPSSTDRQDSSHYSRSPLPLCPRPTTPFHSIVITEVVLQTSLGPSGSFVKLHHMSYSNIQVSTPRCPHRKQEGETSQKHHTSESHLGVRDLRGLFRTFWGG